MRAESLNSRRGAPFPLATTTPQDIIHHALPKIPDHAGTHLVALLVCLFPPEEMGKPELDAVHTHALHFSKGRREDLLRVGGHDENFGFGERLVGRLRLARPAWGCVVWQEGHANVGVRVGGRAAVRVKGEEVRQDSAVNRAEGRGRRFWGRVVEGLHEGNRQGLRVLGEDRAMRGCGRGGGRRVLTLEKGLVSLVPSSFAG